MKKFYLLLWSCLLLTACSQNDDLLNQEEANPNLQLEIDQITTQSQLDFARFMQKAHEAGSRLVRMENSYGHTYQEWYTNFQDGWYNIYLSWEFNLWSLGYQLLIEIDEALALDPNGEYPKHQGVLKTLKAEVLMTLVDYYGPIPYEAGWPQNAQVVDGETVYADALLLLEEAIIDLETPGPDLNTDVYYGNQFELWTRLVGSMQLQALVQTRLVDPSSETQFNNIISSGNYIQTNSQNFEFTYGAGYGEPYNEHPDFYLNYQENGGAADYQSNYLMHNMLSNLDPRLRFYYYRQTNCTPGATCDPDGDLVTLECSLSSAPTHYPPGMPFCWLENGYWGRDHGDPEGIPPDGYQRTLQGLYPIGGNFDDYDSLTNTTPGFETSNGNGQGITPMFQAHQAHWLKAEWALLDGNTALALNEMLSGTQKSIERVLAFEVVDPEIDADYLPTTTQVNDYIDQLADRYNAADMEGKWDLLMEAQLIACYGNGSPVYAAYRRTGYPNSLQYALNPNMDAFPRSLYYPDEAVGSNPNLNQKPNLAVQVFWDSNPAYPVFPAAN